MDRDDAAMGRLARLRGRERALWLVAVVLYGVGDAITTGLGLAGGAAEIGPVVAPLVDRYGLAGLGLAKATTIAGFYGLWRVLTTPGRVAIPLALALVGAAVTGWNVAVVVVA